MPSATCILIYHFNVFGSIKDYVDTVKLKKMELIGFCTKPFIIPYVLDIVKLKKKAGRMFLSRSCSGSNLCSSGSKCISGQAGGSGFKRSSSFTEIKVSKEMYEHSIKVPKLYKSAAKIVKEVAEKKANLKDLVYKDRHVNKKGIYALIHNVLLHATDLEYLLRKSKILEREAPLSPWLAKVLITELLWGKKILSGDSKPIQTVLTYQQILNEALRDVQQVTAGPLPKNPRYIRVNTLYISVEEVINIFRNEGWIFLGFMDTENYDGFLDRVANLGPDEFMIDIHIEDLLIFPANTEFYNHHFYINGLIFLQDKASCLPVHLLNPKPGSTVLDMCAAPGMKTTQIACRMGNFGTIYAVDRDSNRLKTVNELVEIYGITCVTTIHNDALKVNDTDCPNVEYILVDPSCSGSGMVKRPGLPGVNSFDENRLEKLFGFQVMALKHAFRHFPKVKRIVYSTCSLNTKENEEVVQAVITNCNGFKLLDAKNLLPNWYNFGSEKFGDIGKRCLYATPEGDGTNGFFVAVFERLQQGEVNEFFSPKKFYENGELKLKNKKVSDDLSQNKKKAKVCLLKNKKRKTKKNKKQTHTEEVDDKNVLENNMSQSFGVQEELHTTKKRKLANDNDEDGICDQPLKKKKKRSELSNGKKLTKSLKLKKEHVKPTQNIQKKTSQKSIMIKEKTLNKEDDVTLTPKKTKEQLNKDNSLVRESLSNFLQTLSSKGKRNPIRKQKMIMKGTE